MYGRMEKKLDANRAPVGLQLYQSRKRVGQEQGGQLGRIDGAQIIAIICATICATVGYMLLIFVIIVAIWPAGGEEQAGEKSDRKKFVHVNIYGNK
jgi:hypothetical protein